MAREIVYSVCGMCSVRCPIAVNVEDGKVLSVFGNPHAAGLKGALCARGAAGPALLNDDERPQTPLIRVGERGEGKWRTATWDEAFDYVAEKLSAIRAEHGPEALLFSDRGGPFPDLHKAFMRGFGSPNYCNHDSACARNVQHAALSVFGFGRKDLVYDLKNARHVVLQSRNLLEAINVKEVNDLMDARDAGCKLTVIDVRANIPASKADHFFMVRPGTDYCFNLGVLHLIINQKLYNRKFVKEWVDGFDILKEFVQPFTPEYVERETGVSAIALENFVHDFAKAAPHVIWHPGWMTARYNDSFYMSRTAYLINALMGAIGSKGGLPLSCKVGDVGRKGLKPLTELFPKPEKPRADGVGWAEGRTHFDAGPGLVHLAYEAIESGKPYPIRAYIAHRHDPLMAFPDQKAVKKLWEKLDLLVSVTFSWSDTAWNADVVLPMSTFLERESIIASKGGLKPQFFMRKRAVAPRFDTKADWEIYAGLAKRLGMEPLAVDRIEQLWERQLEGTGVSIADFDAKGFVELADKPTIKPVAFKTPSGKVEVVNAKLEKDGLKSLPPYVSPAKPPKDAFRISFGRCGLHTQGHTVNNPLLFELMPENVLWINKTKAKAMGIEHMDMVEVASVAPGGTPGTLRAYVTEFVHPECVFTIHGFGHTLPVESRAKGRGVSDNELMPGGFARWDRAGGAVSMQENYVTVRKV
ncbi:monomeric thiosulfate reductase apoprotein [Humidesulfovibrio mexicanus]|uniref:Monomeric thiosulfate reductase apoprotein n=1 Tax=Humidesulfovibrio mexicanus TaxID=147047 RepID=A0A238Z0P5_9BACT|nr:molybdopterin-dependent oxidoreductase [Humidesulfovibrio mexicanus]SNR76419.1 monomeric thiosulfate reductase apoprotein [Humidesulfovibrio mexicanus]